MPLLEVTSRRPIPIAESSEKARVPALAALGSPDENDWEYRFSIGDQPKVTLSFSCAEIEYPTFSNDVFDPTPPQIAAAGHIVSQAFDNQPVTVEAWPHTTFLIRDPENNQKPVLPTSDISRSQLQNSSPRVEIALSPEVVPSTFDDIQVMVAITLGLEVDQVGLNITYPDNAQTNISLEIRLPGISADVMPPEIREYLALCAQYLLNSNTDPSLSATVWVMPGTPNTYAL